MATVYPQQSFLLVSKQDMASADLARTRPYGNNWVPTTATGSRSVDPEPNPPAEPEPSPSVEQGLLPIETDTKVVPVSSHGLAAWFYGVHDGEVPELVLVACGGDIVDVNRTISANEFAKQWLTQSSAQYWKRVRVREFFLTALFFEQNQDNLEKIAAKAHLRLDILKKNRPRDAADFARNLYAGKYMPDMNKDPSGHDKIWKHFKQNCLRTDDWNDSSKSSSEKGCVIAERRCEIDKRSPLLTSLKRFLDPDDLNG